MKSRTKQTIPYVVLFGVLGIALFLLTGSFHSGGRAQSKLNKSAKNVPATPVKLVQQDSEGIIDGEKNPEKISDRVAYSLFFRFLSERKTEDEKNRVRSHLKMVFGCHDCESSSMSNEQRIAARTNIDTLLAVAGEFERRVGLLDGQARATKEHYGHNLNSFAKAQLKDLQKQKEVVVADVVSSLPNRLGADGAEKLHQFMNEQFKRKVKIGTPQPLQRVTSTE